MFFIQVHQRFIRADSDRQGLNCGLPPEIRLHESHLRRREAGARHKDAQRQGRRIRSLKKYDSLNLKLRLRDDDRIYKSD